VAIGEAGGNPASHSLVMDFYPPAKRATALAALIGSQAFGIALGLALGGWLSVIFNWRMVFILASIPGLAWALLLRLTVREPARGVLGWSPTFFMRVHNMRAEQLGYKIGLASATGLILGNLLAGWLSDKLGTKDVRWYMRVAGFASFLAMPFVLLFLFAPNPYLALVGLACTQLLLTAFMPPLFTMALTLSPTRLRATTSMLMGLALYVVGLGFGPLVIGMLNDALASVYGTHAVRFSLLVELISLATCGALALLANRWLVRELEEATAIRLSGAKAAVDGAAR
jgi:MFS family permease